MHCKRKREMYVVDMRDVRKRDEDLNQHNMSRNRTQHNLSGSGVGLYWRGEDYGVCVKGWIKTRKTRQDKIGQEKTGQDKTEQDKTREARVWGWWWCQDLNPGQEDPVFLSFLFPKFSCLQKTPKKIKILKIETTQTNDLTLLPPPPYPLSASSNGDLPQRHST